MDQFAFGTVVDMNRLTPEEACTILGEPVYEVLVNMYVIDASDDAKGSIRVKSVNRTKREIVVEWRDEK